jgi:hypothetical protein
MSPSSEDPALLLRARMREVDDLDPPAGDDFEFRALRAGRERLRRRQSRTKAFIGAAAAVAVGVLAVPVLDRAKLDSGGSSATSASGVAAPEQAPSSGSGDSGAGLSAPGDKNSSPQSAPPSDAASPTVAELRQRLQENYPDVYSGLELRSTTDSAGASSSQVVLHVTREDPGAMATVRDVLGAGVDVVFAQSAYSSLTCMREAETVRADRTDLATHSIFVTSSSCDVDGRVVVTLDGSQSAAARDYLRTRYGDRVVIRTQGVR